MESKHIQSMIAINANRITDKHARVAAIQTEVRQFKAVMPVVSPLFKDHVETMLKRAYSIIDKTRDEIKKAVEMQKSLQAELRTNRAAEKAAKPVEASVKSYFFINKEGFGDGTLCVELKDNDTYVCHMKDGRAIFHDNAWLSLEFARESAVLQEVDAVPVQGQAPGIYSIDDDGNPKKDGVYDVYYSFSKDVQQRLFEHGVWCHPDGGSTAFGHAPTQGERYIVK